MTVTSRTLSGNSNEESYGIIQDNCYGVTLSASIVPNSTGVDCTGITDGGYNFADDLCHQLYFLGLGDPRGPDDLQGPGGRETGRTLTGRVMSRRPFALQNADALRVDRIAA